MLYGNLGAEEEVSTQAILIYGPPGVGKTRLLSRWAKEFQPYTIEKEWGLLEQVPLLQISVPNIHRLDRYVGATLKRQVFSKAAIIEKKSELMQIGSRLATLKEGTLSFAEAAKAINVSAHILRQLATVGFLQPVSINGIKTARFAQADIAAFDREFISGGRIGETRYARGWSIALIANGIQPVSGPSVDGGAYYLFRRADVQSAVGESRQLGKLGRPSSYLQPRLK